MSRIQTLSDEQVSQCCLLWMHGIADKQIASAIGVGVRVLRTRIKDDKAKERTLFIMGEQITFNEKLAILKAQFKSLFEASYIQKLHNITDKAEGDSDYKTASSNLKWLMEKIMPDKYGKMPTVGDLPIVQVNLPAGLNDGEI